jgi:hypothetical protein
MPRARYTVGLVDAAEHWQAWLERYGADHKTDEERRAAYRDFKSNLARLTEICKPAIRWGISVSTPEDF